MNDALRHGPKAMLINGFESFIYIFNTMSGPFFPSSARQSSLLGSISLLRGARWEPQAQSRIAQMHCKWLIGYQTSGEEKAPPLRVSFIIHGQQMKLVQWEQSIINERR